jgi:hypothetical protein
MKRVLKNKRHTNPKKAQTMNPELFMTQFMTPMYISTTNVVAPIANITTDLFYNNVVDFGTFAWETIGVFVYTFAFIMKEAITAINNNLSFTEKILLALCLYNFISQSVSEIVLIDKELKLKAKLETTEKQLSYLKSSEKMREISEHTWAEEIRNIRDENAKQIKDFEKDMSIYREKIDEQTNIINEHQQNEQKIFQKMAQLSKELRKMKKELEKYQ